jgi:endonuclease-3
MVKKRTKEILQIFDDRYGTDQYAYLHHENAGQLLIATILSAQCTDARVNLVTKDLFVKYPDMQAFADADQAELEEDIHPCGFFRSKAKNIIGCAQAVMNRFDGKVPSELTDLLTLPGVGRKTANVIRGNIFDEPSIVVDTHVKRISFRLGLTDEKDPTKVEFDLMKALPKDHWTLWNLHLITFGREICYAQNPKCWECPLTAYCRESKKCLTPPAKEPKTRLTKRLEIRKEG